MQKEELAKKFIEAGYGRASIDEEDLKVLGIRMQKTFKSKGGWTIKITKGWESFCAFVYEKVSGAPHPGCSRGGRGFRSRSYGKDVAEAIRSTIETLYATRRLISKLWILEYQMVADTEIRIISYGPGELKGGEEKRLPACLLIEEKGRIVTHALIGENDLLELNPVDPQKFLVINQQHIFSYKGE